MTKMQNIPNTKLYIFTCKSYLLPIQIKIYGWANEVV